MELDSLILCVWFNYGMESTFLFFTISFSLLTSHSSLASLASSLLTVAWPRRPAGHVLLQPSPSLHSNSLKSFKSPAMSLIQSLHPWRQPALDFNGCLCLHHRHLRTQSIYSPNSKPASCSLSTRSALTKQGERFLGSIVITMASPTRDPSAAAKRLISKFVASAPKSVVLSTLHHLISLHAASTQPQLSSLALPVSPTQPNSSFAELLQRIQIIVEISSLKMFHFVGFCGFLDAS